MTPLILVTGATGLQGGAVTTALLDAGVPVRALVRDLHNPSARALASRNVELVQGDFGNAASLSKAVANCTGVFSVQLPPTQADDPDSEVRAAKALMFAAKNSGVQCFVQTSVARAGEQNHFVGWKEGRWWNAYWNSKSAVIDAVRDAEFPYHTVLKPAFMMDNFATPSLVAVMYPDLKFGRLLTGLYEHTRLDLIAVEDLGRFAAAAFVDPKRFDRCDITLAAESLTMTQVAATLAEVKGVPIKAYYRTPGEALSAGVDPRIIQSDDWDNVEGYKVDTTALEQFGIPLTPFRIWADQHREQIVVDPV